MATKTAVNPLTHSAMLVCLSLHQWGARKVEHPMNEKSAALVGAEVSMVHTTKRLVGKDAITKVSSAFSRYKAFHVENTLPWNDNGWRIIPSTNYLTYVEAARKLDGEIKKEVEHFLKVYPTIREAAKKKLGKAWNENDYPQPSYLRRKWFVQTDYMAIPDKADFRVDIPKAKLQEIFANVEAQVQAGLENATNDLFMRLYTVVIALRDKLKAYKVVRTASKTGKGKGTKQTENHFRDTAVTNIRDLCELLPRLNITNNPDLVKLAAEVSKTLGAKEPEALRDDDVMREQTIDQADKILAAMADYVGDAKKD